MISRIHIALLAFVLGVAPYLYGTSGNDGVSTGRTGKIRSAAEARSDSLDTATARPVKKDGSAREGTAGSALVFPVARRGLSHVVSHFGDRRDGGRRWHRGVDIAAPRGTPVVAVSDGWVSRVERTAVGGLVIWFREARSDREHYYAHLDAVTVRSGQKVSAGTQIGTVGNTGNAARSAPHLHYAVYVRSDALDPITVLESPTLRLAAGQLAWRRETFARVKLSGAALKSSIQNGRTIAILSRRERVEVVSESGRHLRVRYRGTEGYVARWLLQGA